MRTAKFSLNSSTPAFPREPSFYTEADPFQEVLSTMMTDEEANDTATDDRKKPEKLTLTVSKGMNAYP